MQLKQLREELRFNTEMVSLVDTLKNIAASQYHHMEKAKFRFEEFMNAFSGFFRVVNLVEVENPLVSQMSDVRGIVVVTSDSGFMGGLNQAVIRAAFNAQGELPDNKVSYVVIGEKGAILVEDGKKQFKSFPGIGQETIYEQAIEIKDYIVQEVREKRMGQVLVAHPVALSFSAQTVRVEDILPCGQLFDESVESEVSRRTRGQRFLEEMRKVVIESTFSDISEYLAGVWATSKLFEMFEDSKLAEFSARTMHLEGSLQKLEETEKKFKHLFFKASHEKIDKGMRDSFSATKVTKAKKKKAAQRA